MALAAVACSKKSTSNPTTPTTETSYIEVQGAVVRVTDSDGNTLNDFTELSSTSLPPSAGGLPGFAPIGLMIIDQTSLRKIAPEVINANAGHIVPLVAYVQFFGVTLGGQSIESNTFEFPVDVCATGFDLKGNYFPCLVSFQSTDIRGGCGLINCLGNSGGTSTTTAQTPCTIGQDLPVDCSQCLDTTKACSPNATICAAGTTTTTTDGGTP